MNEWPRESLAHVAADARAEKRVLRTDGIGSSNNRRQNYGSEYARNSVL
jgi:hypothetical protein